MNKIMGWILILSFLFGCSCNRQGPEYEPFDPEKKMAETYNSITLEDGIDPKEASLLADVYFTAYISGCGGTDKPVDIGHAWEIKTVFGVAAQPYAPVFIDKKTGTITCDKGPTIKAPAKNQPH